MKVFSGKNFFEDNGIAYYTSGWKFCRSGWLQIECPFCSGNEGPHLGFNEAQGYFNCWRCGWHSIIEVVKEVTNIPGGEIKNLLKRYNVFLIQDWTEDDEQERWRPKSIELPQGSRKLKAVHKSYLKSRGYDPKKLAKMWDLKGTLSVAKRGYQFRIIAPIYFAGKLVTYQGRAIGGKNTLRWKACPEAEQARDIKECLYGLWQAIGNKCVVVEGAPDVWRLGPGAVATLGIDYSRKQLQLLSQFDEVYFLFDKEYQAQKRADKMAHELNAMGPDCYVLDDDRIEFGHDPGQMQQELADEIMKEIFC